MDFRLPLIVVSVLLGVAATDDTNTYTCACLINIIDGQLRKPFAIVPGPEVSNRNGLCDAELMCRTPCNVILHNYVRSNSVAEDACATATPPPDGQWEIGLFATIMDNPCVLQILLPIPLSFRCENGTLVDQIPFNMRTYFIDGLTEVLM